MFTHIIITTQKLVSMLFAERSPGPQASCADHSTLRERWAPWYPKHKDFLFLPSFIGVASTTMPPLLAGHAHLAPPLLVAFVFRGCLLALCSHYVRLRTKRVSSF